MLELELDKPTQTDRSLWEHYRPPSGAWDEMCPAPGLLREHWRHLVRTLERLGPADLERRGQEARRIIRDNGVTYTVYGDPQGLARPWGLDLIPFLIPSREWGRVEAGLGQRAELLNLLVADLYGPREVLRRGLLPAELVFSHPGFLLPCDGVAAPAGRHVVFYAADLARAPDGGFWVIADRAQAPSGAGYALENRLVLSRVLPSLFRDSQVHRLATFFRAMRRALAALAPQVGEPARTVVLTPGPKNEAYFEHAYLASYLGYTLVQGSDLTVRGDRVYLRGLEGLQRVDVVLRRVDDGYCDPLELREDSVLGVPGLLQAARAGEVAVVNPVGSGFLDNPALMQYLPALARHFLGEELLLPMPQTWWCGTPAGLDHVLAHLDELVVKPVSPGYGVRSVFAGELPRDERSALVERLLSAPARYVGQARLPLGTAPVLAADHLEPRHVVVRSFLVGGPEGYEVLPGGLTRAAPREGQLVVSNQAGGVGKDTWVIASEPERQDTLLVGPDRRPVAAGVDSGVPSRVADDLFWVGRYAERAEGLARLLRVVAGLSGEQCAGGTGPGDAGCLDRLVQAVEQAVGPIHAGAADGQGPGTPDTETVVLGVMTDPTRAGRLPQTLDALVQAARSARDRLSGDTWRVVSGIEAHRVRLAAGTLELADALDTLESLVGALAALGGLTSENMRHGQAWRFLDLGRRLERAVHTASLLRATVVPVAASAEAEALLLESVLTVTDSLIAYRQRYRLGVRVDALLDLLLYDEENPRALAFQLVRLHAQVGALPRGGPGPHRSREERLALEALSALRLSDPARLAALPPGAAVREELGAVLARVQDLLPRVSDAVTAAFFRHEEQPHPLLRLARAE